GFIGSNPMNLLPLTVSDGGISLAGTRIDVPVAGLLRDGQDIVWGIRPEYLRWSASEVEGGIPAEVSVVENLGASVLVALTAGEHRLQVVVSEEDEPSPGQRGWIVPVAGKSLVFDAESTERIG